jgi:hypothetical protein
MFEGKTYYAAELAWALIHRVMPKYPVVVLDGDERNLVPENLRAAVGKRLRCQITHRMGQYWHNAGPGVFTTREAAQESWQRAAREYYDYLQPRVWAEMQQELDERSDALSRLITDAERWGAKALKDPVPVPTPAQLQARVRDKAKAAEEAYLSGVRQQVPADFSPKPLTVKGQKAVKHDGKWVVVAEQAIHAADDVTLRAEAAMLGYWPREYDKACSQLVYSNRDGETMLAQQVSQSLRQRSVSRAVKSGDGLPEHEQHT